MAEKTKLNCEAMLINQWHHKQHRFMEHRSLIQKYITVGDIENSNAEQVKSDPKEIEDNLSSSSDKSQETFRSEIKALPTVESDIQIGVTFQISFEKYKEYKKTFISLEYKIEEHCDYFSSYMEKELKRFENRIKAYATDV